MSYKQMPVVITEDMKLRIPLHFSKKECEDLLSLIEETSLQDSDNYKLIYLKLNEYKDDTQ